MPPPSAIKRRQTPRESNVGRLPPVALLPVTRLADRYLLSGNRHGSVNSPKQPGQNGKKRRLAGTGCAGDKPAFIAIDPQIRNLQYRDRGIAVHQVFND
jgi:hypothetical protein